MTMDTQIVLWAVLMYNMPRKVSLTLCKNKNFSILSVKEDALGTTYSVLQNFLESVGAKKCESIYIQDSKEDSFAT